MYVLLIRMLKKDYLKRITSQQLFAELENFEL